MTKIRTSCVIHVYYVLDNDGVMALLCRQEQACVARLDLFSILRERTCSLVTSQHRIMRARFEFSSTGRDRVRVARKQRVQTWDCTQYSRTTCRQRQCVRYGPTASLIAESETSVDWNHKCHKFVNFYNNGSHRVWKYGNVHHVNWLVQSVFIQGI